MRSANEPAVLAAIDLLGQRWMLRVLWELEPGPLGFLELRRHMGNCSSSVLSDRLHQLQSAGLVDKHGARGSYELTGEGKRLGAALGAVWEWAERRG